MAAATAHPPSALMTRRTARIAQAKNPGAPLAVRAPAQEEYTAVVMASTSPVAPRPLLATAVLMATRSARPRCARADSRARVHVAGQAAFRPCHLSSCLTTYRTLRCAAAVWNSSSRRVELACSAAMAGRSSGRSGSRSKMSRSSCWSWPTDAISRTARAASPDRAWVARTRPLCDLHILVHEAAQPVPRPWPLL